MLRLYLVLHNVADETIPGSRNIIVYTVSVNLVKCISKTQQSRESKNQIRNKTSELLFPFDGLFYKCIWLVLENSYKAHILNNYTNLFLTLFNSSQFKLRAFSSKFSLVYEQLEFRSIELTVQTFQSVSDCFINVCISIYYCCLILQCAGSAV